MQPVEMHPLQTASMQQNNSTRQTPSTWMDCGIDSAVTNPDLVFDPLVPVKQQDNFIHITGELTDTVIYGLCDLSIDWNGVSIYNDEFNVCGDSMLTLPLNIGTLSTYGLACPLYIEEPEMIEFDIKVQLSVLALPGRYTINSYCYSDVELLCVDINMAL